MNAHHDNVKATFTWNCLETVANKNNDSPFVYFWKKNVKISLKLELSTLFSYRETCFASGFLRRKDFPLLVKKIRSDHHPSLSLPLFPLASQWTRPIPSSSAWAHPRSERGEKAGPRFYKVSWNLFLMEEILVSIKSAQLRIKRG